jgi:hypothetical protein
MTQPRPTLCFKAFRHDGDEYIGYVFAQTEGKARALAMRTDPGSCWPYLPEDFTKWRLRRLPSLDGRFPVNTAFWGPRDVPEGCGVTPADLWNDDS